jgi:UDP-N-acetylmuramyl pentapeptide phosphotransferase/UDP-N-acetylglucosamine-1-phosphate transferase
MAGSGLLAASLAFVLVLSLVNIWNFMDGIDGLAASQAGLAALGYALFAGSGPVMWLGLALLAACAGFLPFNLPRARIFLGDVGSGTLGFALAALLSMLLLEPDWDRAPVLALPLCAFVIDATLTLGARMVRGDRWWMPHTQHAYQRWTRRNGRHGLATAAYAGWTLVAIAAMLAMKSQPPAVIMGTVAAVYLLACVAWWRLQASTGRIRGDGQ